MFEIIKVLVIMIIAIPFTYMFFDVIIDLSKRILEVIRPKPVALKIEQREKS